MDEMNHCEWKSRIMSLTYCTFNDKMLLSVILYSFSSLILLVENFHNCQYKKLILDKNANKILYSFVVWVQFYVIHSKSFCWKISICWHSNDMFKFGFIFLLIVESTRCIILFIQYGFNENVCNSVILLFFFILLIVALYNALMAY